MAKVAYFVRHLPTPLKTVAVLIELEGGDVSLIARKPQPLGFLENLG